MDGGREDSSAGSNYGNAPDGLSLFPFDRKFKTPFRLMGIESHHAPEHRVGAGRQWWQADLQHGVVLRIDLTVPFIHLFLIRIEYLHRTEQRLDASIKPDLDLCRGRFHF